jgi:hypothetical protein
MFVCGHEEPIQINEMLYAHNERPVGVDHELSHFVDPRLNRYSFVWFGDGWNIAAFTHLLIAILSQWDADLTWVCTRRYFPPGTGAARIAASWQREDIRNLQRFHRPDGSIDLLARQFPEHKGYTDADIEARGQQVEEASRGALAQLRDAGWSVFHDNELIVATKRIDNIEATFAPPNFGLNRWRLLALGATPSPEVFARPPLRATTEARFPRLRPSRQFLAWLAEHPYTIGYTSTDDLNRLGLVVVGTRRIDVKGLLVQGVIKSIEAVPSSVWRHGPSFDPKSADEGEPR